MVSNFTSSDVTGWPVGVIRWCVLEVLLCSAAILGINVLEFLRKNQMIIGFPKGYLHDEKEAEKGQNYKDEEKKGADDKKAAGSPKKEDIPPQSTKPAVVGLTVLGLDEINDFDFIHHLWLFLLFHVISLGVSFHRLHQGGLIVLWAYLHALCFAAYIFLHVSAFH